MPSCPDAAAGAAGSEDDPPPEMAGTSDGETVLSDPERTPRPGPDGVRQAEGAGGDGLPAVAARLQPDDAAGAVAPSRAISAPRQPADEEAVAPASGRAAGGAAGETPPLSPGDAGEAAAELEEAPNPTEAGHAPVATAEGAGEEAGEGKAPSSAAPARGRALETMPAGHAAPPLSPGDAGEARISRRAAAALMEGVTPTGKAKGIDEEEPPAKAALASSASGGAAEAASTAQGEAASASSGAAPAGGPPGAPPTPFTHRLARTLLWRLPLGILVGLGRFFGWVFSWLTLGLAMAAFGLGALFWMYAQGLPNVEQLKNYRPPTISQIYSSEGELIDEFARERRIFTPIEEIPDRVKWAFISAEDKNFYRHKGYDPIGILKALIDAARGKRLRGASTITQQVMKNFLLDGTRSAERKVKEIILASRLEKALPKEKILELYLNEIFLGQNSYGVTAAAQTYFNKPLEELTLAEVAYLAALPKAPSQYHPVRQYKRAVARRNYVLKEMADNGYVSREAAEAAMKEPLRTVQNGDYPSYRESMPPRDYFTDEIRRQLSADFGADDFFTGGYRIRATKDPRLQKVAARALRHQLEAYDRKKGLWRGPVDRLPREALAKEKLWRAALGRVKAPRDIEGWHLAVVLTSGRKLARIGVADLPTDPERDVIPFGDIRWARPVGKDGRPGPKPRRMSDLLRPGDVIFVRKADRKGREPAPGAPFDHWSLRQIPEIEGAFVAMDAETGRVLAMQGGFSYQQSVFNRATQAKRQPGSAFKPFVYAAALDSGYTPATIVIDAPIEVETPEGVWRPKNSSEKFYGPAPLRTGIVYSRNLMTVRLARAVGLDRVADYAERFGVYDDMKPHLANALGAQETTLFRMVSAYAMFANGGLRVEPTLVDRVQDRWGRTVYRHDRRTCLDCARRDLPAGVSPRIREVRQRVLDPITAYELTSMMQDVVRRGTAAGRVMLDVPVAGKTGTTNEARDVWFVGFTSRLVAGCYIGYDIPKPLGRGAYGGSMCAPVFNEFMQEAVKLYPSGPFPVPSEGVFVKIDRRTGARLPEDATGDNVVSELFRPGEEPAFGASDVIDGGFAMGSDLPLFAPGEEPGAEGGQIPVEAPPEGENVPGTGFGSLSAGGLY